MGTRHKQVNMAVAVLVSAALLSFPRTASFANADQEAGLRPGFGLTFLRYALHESADTMMQAAFVCNDRWYDSYVQSRVQELSYDPRVPQAFGPWRAQREIGAQEANEDGALTEWADHYYIAHDWSEYGRQILSVIPGDYVTVNGRQMHVERIFNYPKDGYYEEITQLVGADAVVFQTCYPNSDMNRIVVGY